MKYPTHLLKLISLLKKLPGIGAKSAERFAFQMISWRQDLLLELSHTLATLKERLTYCTECGALVEEIPCTLCDTQKRNTHFMCVVASPKDLFAIEQTREFHGLFHVLGGYLSPIQGITPDQLRIEILKERLTQHSVKEVILALDATLEGDATALYLRKELAPFSVTITRLAFGIPMGSSLDYIDGGTLARALSGRRYY